jgi:hypothetical protein
MDEARVVQGIGLVDDLNDFELTWSMNDQDRNGHGTLCIKLILGTAPNCEIVPIRVFGARLETSPSILVAALRWAMGSGIKLLNLSLGTSRDDVVGTLLTVCEEARRAGIVMVAAAGPGNGWSYPAVFESVIGVGIAASESPCEIQFRRGAPIECAVANRRRTVTGLDGKPRTVRGTSFGTALITGKVATWLAQDSGLSLEDVRGLLAASCGNAGCGFQRDM